MNPRRRIASTFARAKRENRAALLAYVCAGDPSLEISEALIPRLVESGADVIEIGVPFSDPIADGPVIQAAAARALRKGANLRKILAMAQRLRGGGLEAPLVLMSYANPLLALGGLSAVAESGIDGLIVPDLPFEEIESLGAPAGVANILLAAPTTPPDRLLEISARTQGFLYLVSVSGVTGARAGLPPNLPMKLLQARAASRMPTAVGFGIATPEQARSLAVLADGVIVGSALVEAISSDPSLVSATELVRAFSSALQHPSHIGAHTC